MAVSRNSLLLFAASWLLLAVFLLPAQASAASPATGTAIQAPLAADTIPLFDNNLTVNKAHLAWLVAKEEVGMQATIRYIAIRDGSTGMLAEDMIETAHDVVPVARTPDVTSTRLGAS